MILFYQRSFVSDLNLIWMIKEQLSYFSHVVTCHYKQHRTKDVRPQVDDDIMFLTPFLRLVFVWHYETCCATNASVTGSTFVVASVKYLQTEPILHVLNRVRPAARINTLL